MGLTLALVSQNVRGDRKEVVFTATFDSSYLNSGSGVHGEPLVGSDIGLDLQLDYVEPIGLLAPTDTSAAYVAHYNKADGELQAYKANGTTNIIPVASGVDLSTYTVTLRAVGKGKVAV